ncbi:hypothetical protein Vafri_3842, partial [Volvox africanus]
MEVPPDSASSRMAAVLASPVPDVSEPGNGSLEEPAMMALGASMTSPLAPRLRIRLVSSSQDRSLVVVDLDLLDPTAVVQTTDSNSKDFQSRGSSKDSGKQSGASIGLEAGNVVVGDSVGCASPGEMEKGGGPTQDEADAVEARLAVSLAGQGAGGVVPGGADGVKDRWQMSEEDKQQQQEDGPDVGVKCAARKVISPAGLVWGPVLPRGSSVWWRLLGLGGYPHALQVGGRYPGLLAVGCGDRTLRTVGLTSGRMTSRRPQLYYQSSKSQTQPQPEVRLGAHPVANLAAPISAPKAAPVESTTPSVASTTERPT